MGPRAPGDHECQGTRKHSDHRSMDDTATSPGPMMEKSFDPTSVEPRWRAFWEQRGLYRAEPDSARPPFCMVIPPPNITGRLHVGHGLNNALQDVLARW